MARDMWDMLSDLETQIVNVQTSLDLETLIVQKYDRINKDDREKLTDYEHIGTLTRVLFDRLYDEANALNAICAELFDAIHKQKSVAGGGME